MKIAVVNTFHAKDITIWSGIPFHITLMLDKIFNSNISYISIPPVKRNFYSYALGFYYNKIRKQKYYTWADLNLINRNQKNVNDAVKEHYDIIITFQFYLVPLLKKKNNKIIHWNDATFQNLYNFYSGYSNFSNYSYKAADTIQKKALELSDKIIYSSNWAIESATPYYETDVRKLQKITFASNFKTTLDKSQVEEFIKSRRNNIIKLLFLTADWQRKGGADAIKVLEILEKSGLEVLLYVVGTDVPKEFRENKSVIHYGYINKNSAEGEKKLVDLFRDSTFLIMPTRVDTTPVVFSEANSFALPVITTKIGAIPSVIEKNINGCYFEIEDFIDGAVNYIKNYLPESEQYEKLCYSSFNYYQTNMSWEQVQTKFSRIIEELSAE